MHKENKWKRSRSLKAGIVVCLAITVLAFSNMWFLIQINNLQYRVNKLTYDKDNLQIYYDKLKADYYDVTEDYDNYRQNHFHSNSEFEMAQEESYSNGYDDGKFTFYYIKPKTQKYGVENLKAVVNQVSWTHSYEEGVFDCSEMSAYMERYLENNGFHAKILVGNCPFDSGYHAWVLAETSEGKYMPVEATDPRVVLWHDEGFDNYFEYDHKFETIQDALAYSQTSFDWWTVYP